MSTKSVCGMSCGEMHEFALVLDKAGFNADLVQKIVNSRDNKHAKAMYVAITDKNKIIEKNQYLKRLSGDTPIIIPACDGSHTIAEAEDVFKAYIDSDFKNWGIDKQGEPTEKMAVAVCEMIKDATWAQMFGSFGVDLNKLCLTQHQIKVFCKKYPEWLRGYSNATLFLFKDEDQFFVARVHASSDGLAVHALRFGDDHMWNTDCQRRLVAPQLET